MAINQAIQKMQAAIEHFKEELKGLRTGRANAAMLDNVVVEAYGSQMKIKDLACVSVPESRQLLISPFDTNSKGMIAKAIEKANLGFMPNIDGNIIRIKVPPMDDSLRKEMVKLCYKKCEEAKVGIRNARRDGKEFAKRQKTEGNLNEEQLKKIEKSIQDLTDKCCKEIDDLAAKKEKEISTI